MSRWFLSVSVAISVACGAVRAQTTTRPTIVAQEPGADKQIKEFCETKFNVKFPLFAKISVKGQDKCPLYQFLTSKETNGDLGGEIRWNFEKFLVSREGKVVQRFAPAMKPDAKELVDAVEAQLAKPAAP